VVGLFKKVVIADSLAIYADAGYAMLRAGQPLDHASAWVTVLCYSFQLYYDFSGYSDMAIGLARMFGFRLPVNFYSPYKSTSIIDFWRRWHITLSRFLRDYLYIPLGGFDAGPCGDTSTSASSCSSAGFGMAPTGHSSSGARCTA
jgi:D-alanyl-lipoteichoic acid acyltransferase DltB (MBOAT superfamily)